MAAYPDGTPCWADAMLNDLEAGKRFYGGLLGWTFGAGEEQYGQYTQAYGPDGKNVAALSPKPDGRMPTVWNLYLASSDIRATAARIRDSGGQLIMQPMAVGAFGTMLMAADPGGAVFGVWQPGTHGGFEATGVPGSYIWTEIYTRETERTDPFYEEVFGFGSKRIEDEAIDFRVFVPEGQEVTPGNAVLGRFRMGEGFPEELAGALHRLLRRLRRRPRRGDRRAARGPGHHGSDGFAFRPFSPGERRPGCPFRPDRPRNHGG